MTPADRHTLARKLEYLRKQLEHLDPYRQLSKDALLSELEKRLAVERLLEISIQSVIDLSRLLVALKDWRGIRDERDALLILAERLLQAKGFRNVLVHEYVDRPGPARPSSADRRLGSVGVRGGAGGVAPGAPRGVSALHHKPRRQAARSRRIDSSIMCADRSRSAVCAISVRTSYSPAHQPGRSCFSATCRNGALGLQTSVLPSTE